MNPSSGPNLPSDDDAPGLGAPPSGPLFPPPSTLAGAVEAGGSEDDEFDGFVEFDGAVWLLLGAGVGAVRGRVDVKVETRVSTVVLSCLLGPSTTSVDRVVVRMSVTLGVAGCEPLDGAG